MTGNEYRLVFVKATEKRGLDDWRVGRSSLHFASFDCKLLLSELSIFPRLSIFSYTPSMPCKYFNSSQIVSIASTSANEATEIFKKFAKSFGVLLLLPSAIFNDTEMIALFNYCFRLYFSDSGKASESL